MNTSRLHANESPFGLSIKALFAGEQLEELLNLPLNHYPDATYSALKQQLTTWINQIARMSGGIAFGSQQGQFQVPGLIIGNGSDECIRMIYDGLLKQSDSNKVMAFGPTFSEYKVIAESKGVQYVEQLSLEGRMVNLEDVLDAVKKEKPSVIMLCNPNNPTGFVWPIQWIQTVYETLQNESKGYLVVDEAYGEFATQSVLPSLECYPNMLVTRTLSKALGLAGVRIGYIVCSQTLEKEIEKVRMPYNLSGVSAYCAEKRLEQLQKNEAWELLSDQLKVLESQKEKLMAQLMNDELRTQGNLQPYFSGGNFIYMKLEKDLYKQMVKAFEGKPIRIRTFIAHQGVLENNNQSGGAIRITIGNVKQMREVSQTLKEVMNEYLYV